MRGWRALRGYGGLLVWTVLLVTAFLLPGRGQERDAGRWFWSYEGMPPLLEAIDTGETNKALALIQAGQGMHENWKGLSPLGLATLRGQSTVVKALLGAGAKADSQVTGNGVDSTRTWEAMLPEIDRMTRRKQPELFSHQSNVLPVLVLAAMQSDVETVKLLLDHGADPNSFVKDARNGDKNYALLFAARAGRLEMIKLLLARGCNAREAITRAVEWCDKSGQIQCSEVLLKAQEQVAFKPDPLSEALIAAAGRGDYEQLLALQFRGARINYTNELGQSALTRAVFSKQLESAAWLVKNKADHHTTPRAGYGMKPLYETILDASSALFELLLPLEYAQAELDSALLLAVEHNRDEMVQPLLRKGANANVRSENGVSALAFAEHEINDRIVALLKAAGGKSVLPKGVVLQSPLFGPADRGDLVRIRHLLSRGVDPDGGKRGGVTPLSELLIGVAAASNRLVIAEMLLKAGAGVNAVESSWNPMPLMHTAVSTGDPELVRLLVKHGANPNEFSFFGGTVLHQAVRDKNLPMVQTLLQLGADPKARDEKGQTPLALADSLGLTNIAECLRKGGQ